MMIINLNNVEDLIFYNTKVKKLLPEFKNIFDTWAFSKHNIGFRQLTKRTLSDFLSSLNEEHINILSGYFGEKIAITSIDYHIILNEKMKLEDDVEFLMKDDFNFDIYRDKENLYVTFWR